MADAPFFTVVVATFNRGRHITLTIKSALEQTFTDFELLVVSDGATDDTLAQVPRDDPRVGCIGLPSNSGSQSAPNNVGVAAARGRYIAYLGHDDIWMPDHLEELARVIEDGCDVAVSGCAYHGPPGTDLVQITGLFEEPRDAARHFFPPSSFAHLRPLAAKVGGWKSPLAINAPVDADFLLAINAVGARFASTGNVTVHKFAAGHRYLSYLDQSSAEQCAMLSRISSGAVDRRYCAELVDQAKASGTFMKSAFPDYSAIQPGKLFKDNRSNKGIDRPKPVPLMRKVYVPQTTEPRALDWYAVEQTTESSAPYRWSGPSLRPKLLVPFTGDCNARITLHLSAHDPGKLIDEIRITFNGREADHRIYCNDPSVIYLEFVGRILLERPSAAELALPRSYCPAESGASADRRNLGVIMFGFTIAPISNCKSLGSFS